MSEPIVDAEIQSLLLNIKAIPQDDGTYKIGEDVYTLDEIVEAFQ